MSGPGRRSGRAHLASSGTPQAGPRLTPFPREEGEVAVCAGAAGAAFGLTAGPIVAGGITAELYAVTAASLASVALTIEYRATERIYDSVYVFLYPAWSMAGSEIWICHWEKLGKTKYDFTPALRRRINSSDKSSIVRLQMENTPIPSRSFLGCCKVFVPLIFIVGAVHIIMMLSPIISSYVLGVGKDFLFRAVVMALLSSFVALLLIRKYYNSDNNYRNKMKSAFLPKPGLANLEKISLEFVHAFAVSLIGYLFLLEVSAEVIQNIFDGIIIRSEQRLSYMMAYIIASPLIAVTYLRLRE